MGGQIGPAVIAAIHRNAARRFIFVACDCRVAPCDDHTVCPWDKVNRHERCDDACWSQRLDLCPPPGRKRKMPGRPTAPPLRSWERAGLACLAPVGRPTCPPEAAFATAQVLRLEEGLWLLLPSPSRFTLLVSKKNI